MSNEEILQEYSNSINDLKKQCSDVGMTENEFRRMYFQSLMSLRFTKEISPRRYVFTRYRILLISILAGLYVMYNYKTIYSSVICNVQEYIYPGLKILRQISIPFISLFPSLTDFYHETCLIQNPFFTVVDMDCWPCSPVANVLEVNNPTPVSEQYTAPFIYETDQKPLNLRALKEMYIKNIDTFKEESHKISVNNKYYLNPDDLFNQESDDMNFYIWRFNNIKVAKLLRQVIPRPKVVPKFGQSIERFIIIDKSHTVFRVPDTECSFSFVLALSGTREIHLLPAEECKHQCKTLKVELKEPYLLWYNWWYWRPAMQPSMANDTFIAHVGSYC